MEDFKKEGNSFRLYDDQQKMIAEITFQPYGEDKVLADHTFVDPSLRGRGVAEKMVDRLVEEMNAEGKKIVLSCPYVVELFERKPDKYAAIVAE